MLKRAITYFAALTNCATVVAAHMLHCTLMRASPAYAHTQYLATSQSQNTCVATTLHAGADQSRTLVRASELPRCSVGRQKSLTAALSDTPGNI